MITPIPDTPVVGDVMAELDPVIEPEETGSEEPITKPWDPKRIRITTKNFTLREIFTQMKDDDLDLAPDFQRSFVWKDSQQIRLIESVLLGIPLPAFYFNQDAMGAHQVIDGVQRLTTVKLFMSDNLILNSQHLEYLSMLQGETYSTLDQATKRRFAGTQIVAHIIEPQTPDEVKYDIFNRVNTGGSPLTAQEIRHCMSKARSRAFLKRLVEHESFDNATDFAFWSKDASGQLARDNRRMSDREMALRFCAFRHFSSEEYSQAASLDAFLLEYTRKVDRATDAFGKNPDLEELERSFKRAMVNCVAVLGNGAFRRWPPNAARRGPINRAIFESQALALADWDVQMLRPKREPIAAALRSLFDTPEYDDAVRAGTGDVRKVERRLEMPRKLLDQLLE